MKWIYLLFILTVLCFIPSCSATQTAQPEVVLAYLKDVQEFDQYSKFVVKKIYFLRDKNLLDKETKITINNYNDAIYGYYTRAWVLLAAGDIAGYKENLDRAWAVTQAMEKIADDIARGLKKESKLEGQDL